ncbi:AMP-binding protein, partial [Methylopila musalis]
MRLAPASDAPLVNPVAGVSTLDEVLTHNAQRDPDGLALVDARLRFEGTWRETDRAVSALASAFAAWRLKPDAVVGVQLGSSFESALVCLALWRAGLVAALLPLAWRRREITEALNGVGAEAVVVRTRAAGGRPAEAVCEAAVDLERLRFIGVFGEDEPDGATPLDEVLEQHAGRFVRADRPEDAADHVAVITFDAGAVPVARTHNELVALGLAPLLAAKLTGGDRLFSTLDIAGLPGLACGFTPWIVTRCAATFHQPTGTEAFAEAARVLNATLLVAPGVALPRLVKDGALAGVTLTAVLAAWREPDPRSSAATPAIAAPTFVDAIAFGELGLVASERPAHGRPVPLAL